MQVERPRGRRSPGPLWLRKEAGRSPNGAGASICNSFELPLVKRIAHIFEVFGYF